MDDFFFAVGKATCNGMHSLAQSARWLQLERFYLTYCDGLFINTRLEPLARPYIIEMGELVSLVFALLVIGAVFSRR
jgi:hypothetical protein